MTYSEEQLHQLQRDFLLQRTRLSDLLVNVGHKSFDTEQALRFSRYGLGRRIKLVQEAFRGIFNSTPPNTVTVPEVNSLTTTSIFLQALISNIYGCLDNIAWIWFHQNHDNEEIARIHRNRIGLTTSHASLRQSLPSEFNAKLEEYDDWISHIKEIRDALAHQIPIYLVPYMVNPENRERHDQLEREKFQVLLAEGFEAFERLETEQKELSFFKPYWVKDTNGKIQMYVLHPQAICDVMTLAEILEAFLKIFAVQGRS